MRLPRDAQRGHKPRGRGLRPGRERGLPQEDAQGAAPAHPPGARPAGAQRADRRRLPRLPQKAPARHGRADILYQRAAAARLRLLPGRQAAGGAAPRADLSGVQALPHGGHTLRREHDKADCPRRPAAELPLREHGPLPEPAEGGQRGPGRHLDKDNHLPPRQQGQAGGIPLHRRRERQGRHRVHRAARQV